MNLCAREFADDVVSCVDDITALLPPLFDEFDERIVVTAMAGHIGGAMHRLMLSGDFTPRLARRLLGMMESTAFFKAGVAPEGEDPLA